MPFAYIMGHGFSGSTLLTFLLGAHPEVATVGEVGIAPSSRSRPEEFVCSCHRPVRECPFWSDVAHRMGARGEPFDPADDRLQLRHGLGRIADAALHAGLRGPAFELARSVATAALPAARRERDRFLRRYAAFVETVREVQGGRVFVDASKEPERALLLRRVRALDGRVVHLVRDGRAVALSTMRNRGLSAEAAATSWARDLRRCERARRAWSPERWTTLRYEDLCRDPQGTLDTLFRFLGLAPRPIGDFRAVEQHIVGNRMRLQRTSEIRLDERWRQTLVGGDLGAVERVLGAANERYGYAA